ncbi:MAG: amino acid permease [Deltaproteobacteria bacterium]|nr:amino acid permease [Deltaproteobacteria bacterium]
MDIAPKKELSLFDSVCIIVGIIIGAGIFEITPTVASCMGGWAGILAIWLAGGLLALTGALCYAELATAYPHEGGDYVYQTRAYGSWAGYLFGWSQLVIIRPGDIALLAFVFARYAQTFYAPFEKMRMTYAAIAVVVLTAINILGVKEGKWTQNLLTVIKSVGLLAIIAVGLFAPVQSLIPAETSDVTMGGLKLALILVLFTFGGWNEMAYVAGEVKQPKRNIVRALVIGTVLVTVLYMLVNGAFLHSLGQGGMASSEAIAVDTMATVFPVTAGRVIAIIICISALGAVNGLIFTGARISYAMGSEHRSFRGLGSWSTRFGTPVRALIVQGCLSLAIVIFAGSFIDTILYTAPVVWVFFLATGLSVFVLRRKDPLIPRPYKVSGFPVPTIIFCACCIFMLYSSVTYAMAVKPVGLITVVCVLLGGAVVYWFTEVGRERKNSYTNK